MTSPVVATDLSSSFEPSPARWARDARLAAGRSVPRDCVRAVTHAAKSVGRTVWATSIPLDSYLDAHLSTVADSAPSTQASLSGGTAPNERVWRDGTDKTSTYTLSWTEDKGWSLSHSRFDRETTPPRYLRTSLVPIPSQLSKFLRARFAETREWKACPASSRYRSQPLQPILDHLARYSQSRAPHGVATVLDPGASLGARR